MITIQKQLKNIWKAMDGNKMYLVGIAMVLYGAIGFFLKFQSADEAMKMALAGLAMISGKSALSKLE